MQIEFDIYVNNKVQKKEIMSVPENIAFYEYLKTIKHKINSKTQYEDVNI